jgi:hypothetical protein
MQSSSVMSRRAELHPLLLCAMASLVGLLAVRAEAGDAEDRAQRDRCTQLWANAPKIAQGFEVPRNYEPVSEPGGPLGLTIVKPDGRDWHPAPSDIQGLGAKIETPLPTNAGYCRCTSK